MFLFDFLPEKWRIVHENPVSARIYNEVLKNLAESIANFRRKTGMFSIFGGENPSRIPPNREACSTLWTNYSLKKKNFFKK